MLSTRATVAIILCLSLTWGYGQRPASEDSLNWVRPPLKAGTVALQLIAGTVGGIAGFYGVAAPLAFIGDGGGSEGDAGAFMGALLGASIGMPLGAAMGVATIGRTDSTTGSIFAACIGGAIGLFLLGPPIIEARLSPYLVPLAAAAGATLTFNGTRRYRRPTNADAKKAASGAKLPAGSQPKRGTP